VRTAPDNTIGLTSMATYDDWTAGPPLERRLIDAGIDYKRQEVPQILGMGGNACLLLYTSQKTGNPVTVLVVPHLVNDMYSEDYFYFAGMTEIAAAQRDWLTLFDQCEALIASSSST
jgi:hypothetical protein